MRKTALLTLLAAASPYIGCAAQVQGVITDWNCTKRMVQDGRDRVLKRNHSCLLAPNYSRPAYGIITDDKRYYQLDDAGRAWALKLLKDTRDKDNLRVIVDGDIDGELIHVRNMSEL
jgi:hypothetical protein